MKPNHPHSYEIPLKSWILDRAAERGCGYTRIWDKIRRGHYPDLKLRRVNKRVVFVDTRPGTCSTELLPNETTLKSWLMDRAKQLGISYSGVYMRLVRGKEPWPELRRVTARTIFVINP